MSVNEKGRKGTYLIYAYRVSKNRSLGFLAHLNGLKTFYSNWGHQSIFCSKMTPSSKCLSIWLSSVYSFLSLSSSHHHLSFNHLEMCRLVFFINMYLYDMIIYPIFIYLSIYPSIIYLSIYISVFPFIHILNNNQHLSSDHFEMSVYFTISLIT